MAASPAARCATPRASRAASYTTPRGTTDFGSAPEAPRSLFEEDAYARDSRKAVVTFLRAHREILETDEKGRGIEGLFAGLHISSLKRMLEEADLEDQDLAPESSGPSL